ncbi:hypothetical protein ACN42_g55 [Penicillium freii]|uniref:Uncharacterized protein n=1 Tax=Penicillium freii TaxID=48697 RepID=A0A117NT55_PENFR|nr:hypothetical protein ACN42_g55 [Penicillium freii]
MLSEHLGTWADHGRAHFYVIKKRQEVSTKTERERSRSARHYPVYMLHYEQAMAIVQEHVGAQIGKFEGAKIQSQ